MKILSIFVIAALFSSCGMIKKRESSGNTPISKNAQSENKDAEASQKAAALTANWPDSSALAAKQLIEKYGEPTETTSESLIWRNVAPFKEILVHKTVYSDRFPLLHQNAVEHVIDYRANGDKVDDVWRFDGAVVFHRTRGEMSASSQNEAMNILAMNLADEIMKGKRTAESARIRFGQETLDYMNGKLNPITQALTFGTQLNTADAGETITDKIVWKGERTSNPRMNTRQAQEAKKK